MENKKISIKLWKQKSPIRESWKQIPTIISSSQRDSSRPKNYENQFPKKKTPKSIFCSLIAFHQSHPWCNVSFSVLSNPMQEQEDRWGSKLKSIIESISGKLKINDIATNKSIIISTPFKIDSSFLEIKKKKWNSKVPQKYFAFL